MFKKIIVGLIVALLAAGAIALGAGAASATGNHGPEVSGKPVTVCHATGSSSNPYVKLENVPLVQFLGNNGHADHSNDIWAAFSYVKRTGAETWETVNVPAQGDTSLLAFDKCKKPRVDTPVTQPEPVYNDLCGTSNDVFSVAPGEGYTVTGPVNEGANQVITVTLNEGYKWSTGGDNYTPLRFVKPAFTNVDCDLPDTGAPEMATMAGWTAVGGLVLLAVMAIFMHRRRENS